MAHGLPRSLARRSETATGFVRKVISVNHAITVAGATGKGWGSRVIGGFSEGDIVVMGTAAYLTFTGPTDAALSDTWSGDFGVGSTPASDGTISGADVDFVASTALDTATAEVSDLAKVVEAAATPVVLDNTAGTLELNLNLLVDDADISADDIDITATGTVVVTYYYLGDD